MAKVVIPNIGSGYSLAKIDAAFQTIEDELNNKVLYRDNPISEPNHMENDLDMNGNDILNAMIEGVSLSDLVEDTIEAGEYAIASGDTALESAAEADGVIEDFEQRSNAALGALGGIDIGFYNTDPTINEYNEFIKFERVALPENIIESYKPKLATVLPYQIDSATTPDPLNDTNLKMFNDVTKEYVNSNTDLHDTLARATSRTDLEVDPSKPTIVIISDRGDARARVVSGLTPNGIDIIQHDTLPLQLEIQVKNYIDIRWFGADGTAAVEATSIFQRAIDILIGKISGNIHAPDRYLIDTLNTYSNQNYDFNGDPASDVFWANRGGPISYVRISGVTKAASSFVSIAGNPMFQPSAVAPSAYHELHINDMLLQGFNKTGKPINLNRDATYPYRYSFERCSFVNFEYGYEYDRNDGTLGPINGYATFDHCQFSYNRCGASVGGDNTTFNECWITYNDWCGLWTKSGAVINIRGGKIEYNGASGWGTWTPPVTGALTGPFQWLCSTGAESVHFDGVYFEPKSSVAANNINYVPFAMYKEGALSVIANIVFDGGCRMNGLTSARLLQIDADVIVQGLTFDSFYLRNLKLGASFAAIISGDSSVSIKDFMWMGGRISDIKDSGGSTIFDWEMFTDFINLDGSMDWSQGSGMTSTITSSEKGTVKQVNAHIRADGSVQFGSGIGVNKESAGKFLITFQDRNWSGSSPSEFFAQAQPVFRSAGSQEQNLARVEFVSVTQVRVHLFTSANNGTYIDASFTLDAQLVY